MHSKVQVEGISHITLICRNLEKSAQLFCDLFGAIEVYSSQERKFSISKEKFFLIDNLWVALMEGEPIERSYNHIAFRIKEEDLQVFQAKLEAFNLDILPGRSRSPQEGQSIYFYDYDNHLFELHTGDLTTRLNYYQNILKLRAAEESEIGWVNSCYDQVEFVHSDFQNEVIAIAEFDQNKAGLGRLIKVDESNLELGGMYVFEPFRGKGIAKELVKFLLAYIEPFQTVYCIPFEHLLPLYKQCGFINCSNFESVPPKILAKYRWCQEKYIHPTSLLVLEQIAAERNEI